jgi:NAD(P)-dependent dehydrogenase (short-subunit alcohol dehydrogenase family)
VIDTDMSNFTKTEDGRSLVIRMQALKRIGAPADVASVVAFLASDAACWITGDTIAVDGLQTLSRLPEIAPYAIETIGKCQRPLFQSLA